MALDDYLEPEVAIAVAVTAAVASPTVRKAMRKGAVYGLAGLLMARDKLASLASNVTEAARKTTAAAGQAAGPQEHAEAPAAQPAPG